MLRAFRETEPAIKRLLGRFFHRAQDVEDIAQETFLRAFAAEAETDIASPRAFLLKTARNLAINEKARLANALTDYMEDSPEPDVFGSGEQVPLEDELQSRQKMAAFAEAISSLPDQCRRVFLLRKVHGLSQQEVASRLGISTSTVEKHVASGLLKTSQYLRQQGFEVGAAAQSGPRRAASAAKAARSGDV
jgi:RNA polymerase sigma-70 factor (ECF subfamily)